MAVCAKVSKLPKPYLTNMPKEDWNNTMVFKVHEIVIMIFLTKIYLGPT